MTRRLIGLCTLLLATIVPRVAAAQFGVTEVASGLTEPVAFVQVPSDPTAQVILQKGGRILVLKDGVILPTDFLDLSPWVLSAGEQGLLALAFSPSYASDGRVFVYFIDSLGRSVLSRFGRSAGDPLVLDPATRFDFVWPGGQPYIGQIANHHLGAQLAFGPDGFLYFGLGDGDWPNDPNRHAQDPMRLQGKMLRLDVSVSSADPEGYDVPASNPFVGRNDVLPEIWAVGLRNPWRWAFDDPAFGGTGAMLIADVGQDGWEEIDYEPAGAGGRNYGWPNREGAHDHILDNPPFSWLMDPIFEYDHNIGSSITGGVVYRGAALDPAYRGRYFYGDFIGGQVWSLAIWTDANGEGWASDNQVHAQSAPGASGIASFGTDAAGEMYLVSYSTGKIFKVVPGTSPPPPTTCPPPDPFEILGGGICVNGGWLPPTIVTPPPPPPPPPPTPGGCPLPDPFEAIGGGVCVNGGWLPPGWLPPAPPAALSGDFDLDGQADILWQHPTGPVYAWLMNGATLSSGASVSVTAVGSDWRVVGTSDLTDDHKPDLLWQNQATGEMKIDVMDGLVKTAEQVIPLAVNTPWRMVTTGDFNDDGLADIVWLNEPVGTLYVWFMEAPGGVARYASGGLLEEAGQTITLGPFPTLRVVGSGDVNLDGKRDLMLYDSVSGHIEVWYMDGKTRVGVGATTPPAAADLDWHLRVVADFNHDGMPDLVWQNMVTGEPWVWFMAGTSRIDQGPLQPYSGTPWRLVGAR